VFANEIKSELEAEAMHREVAFEIGALIADSIENPTLVERDLSGTEVERLMSGKRRPLRTSNIEP
jgi:hypothetical protein